MAISFLKKLFKIHFLYVQYILINCMPSYSWIKIIPCVPVGAHSPDDCPLLYLYCGSVVENPLANAGDSAAAAAKSLQLCLTLCDPIGGHQAPPSLGFSRQEHWSGLPFPSPMHASEKWKWSRSISRRLRRCQFNPWVGKIPWKRKWQYNSSFLAWRVLWTEESGVLQSIGLKSVRHNLATKYEAEC